MGYTVGASMALTQNRQESPALACFTGPRNAGNHANQMEIPRCLCRSTTERPNMSSIHHHHQYCKTWRLSISVKPSDGRPGMMQYGRWHSQPVIGVTRVSQNCCLWRHTTAMACLRGNNGGLGHNYCQDCPANAQCRAHLTFERTPEHRAEPRGREGCGERGCVIRPTCSRSLDTMCVVF